MRFSLDDGNFWFWADGGCSGKKRGGQYLGIEEGRAGSTWLSRAPCAEQQQQLPAERSVLAWRQLLGGRCSALLCANVYDAAVSSGGGSSSSSSGGGGSGEVNLPRS